MRINVFDFDNTLVETPIREQAESLYRARMDHAWPFVGFYGRLEPFAPPVFPDLPDASYLLPDVAACHLQPEGLRVPLTERPVKTRQRILDICTHLRLGFDEAYFRVQSGFDKKGESVDFRSPSGRAPAARDGSGDAGGVSLVMHWGVMSTSRRSATAAVRDHGMRQEQWNRSGTSRR